MSDLVGAMYASANGMNAHSGAINTVSDNIANVNTPGFKEGFAQLQDLVASGTAGNPSLAATGEGSTLGAVSQRFDQGAIQAVGGSTNLAIQGNGFFIVHGNFNGQNGNFYTRDGSFHIDNSGKLVTSANLVVQGYGATSSGVISGALGNIVVSNSALSLPQATTTAQLNANLSANQKTPASFSLSNPGETSNFSASYFVYDSLGEAHNIDMYFRATGSTSYEWHALVNGAEVVGGVGGTPSQIGTGTLTFNSDGGLVSLTGNPCVASFVGATGNQNITIDFGDATSSGGTGLQGMTCFANSSAITAVTQDGYSEGSISTLSINSSGTLVGVFTNGNNIVLGQIALGTFTNLEGLQRLGGSLFQETLDSGQAAIGTPTSGSLGTVIAGSLESSNVDLSTEFVRLIALERGFQANTRSIKAASDMLTDLVNIGR